MIQALGPQIILSAYMPGDETIWSLLHGAHGLDGESNTNQVSS